MRDLPTAPAMAAALIMTLVGAGCSQTPEGVGGGAAAAADEESPEFAAMEYRQGLMHVFAFKVGTLRDMAEGTIDADEDVFAEYAADLDAAADMLIEGFDGLPASDTASLAGSGALPDVWSGWDDFVQKASDLGSAAEEVAARAASPGFAVGPDSVEPLEPVCGGCHRTYRQR